MTLKSLAKLAVASTWVAALACSAGGNEADPRRPSNGATGGSASSNGGNTGQNPPGSGGGISVTPPAVVDPNDKRDVPVREKTCDATGKCTCLRLAMLGTLETAAEAKDTQPFINWLNSSSNDTATVKMIAQKPTMNADFLKDYDILLLANVNTWTFDASEKAAVQKWSRELGGGIIALTGFVSTNAEVTASNQLIEFSGVSYNTTVTAQGGEPMPVYYKGGNVNLKRCLAWGADEAFITAPIKFTPQTGTLEKLTLGLDYIGAFIGWGVTAPAGATVVAKDPVSGANMVVAHEVDAKGRVLALGDEWAVFSNQWVPQGTAHNATMDPTNICWQPAVGTTPGFLHSVQTLYQTKQFWYDAINWVAPPNQCNFIIDDPDVVTVVR
ncbi:MAG TPA: hypothetical protein VER33_21730 [Polyangiaceae bacterium]|nr:hypothetical protein [Polyangiaceae bacterium]